MKSFGSGNHETNLGCSQCRINQVEDSWLCLCPKTTNKKQRKKKKQSINQPTNQTNNQTSNKKQNKTKKTSKQNKQAKTRLTQFPFSGYGPSRLHAQGGFAFFVFARWFRCFFLFVCFKRFYSKVVVAGADVSVLFLFSLTSLHLFCDDVSITVLIEDESSCHSTSLVERLVFNGVPPNVSKKTNLRRSLKPKDSYSSYKRYIIQATNTTTIFLPVLLPCDHPLQREKQIEHQMESTETSRNPQTKKNKSETWNI